MLSCEMVKINKNEKAQLRNFVLTTKRILNVDKKVKRSIDLVNLAGISLSIESHEFVIHVLNDYDYRFSSEKYRETVLYYAVAAYYNVHPISFWFPFTSTYNINKQTKRIRCTPPKQIAPSIRYAQQFADDSLFLFSILINSKELHWMCNWNHCVRKLDNSIAVADLRASWGNFVALLHTGIWPQQEAESISDWEHRDTVLPLEFKHSNRESVRGRVQRLESYLHSRARHSNRMD